MGSEEVKNMHLRTESPRSDPPLGDLLLFAMTSDWSPVNPASSLPQCMSCFHNQTIVRATLP